MALDKTLSVRINGECRQMAGPASVAELVKTLGFDPARVAVERNLEIVPRGELAGTAVEDGDCFEIVRFVGGG